MSGNTTIHTNTVITTGIQTYGDNAASDTITLGNSTALTTTNAQITFNGIVNSESAEQNNLTLSVGTSEVEFNGAVGGSRLLGAIAITGALDLNAAITSAASLTVSTTSDLGANVTTSGTQTYTG
nr:hypothetical protein [Oxalobacteraceae bacterium]